MGVVAQTCQRVAVMYAGQIVEMADKFALFAQPRHPYTVGLLNCVPRVEADGEVRPLAPIAGHAARSRQPAQRLPVSPALPAGERRMQERRLPAAGGGA